MEQQAIVILFTGNSLPDETSGKLCSVLSKDTFAHPEDVKIYTFDEDNLAKLIAEKITKVHTPKCTESTTEAATILSKEFPLNNNVAFAIHFGRIMPEIYARIKYGKAIQHDIDTVERIKVILDNGVTGRFAIERQGGDKETIEIIRKIFNNYFDEKGNAR